MLNFKTPLYVAKPEKKKVFLRKAALRTHTLKLYNFRMLINMSIVVLQVPDTLYLLATCTFSKYSKVDSVVIGWRLWNMCSHGSLGEIINFMLHIQLRLLFFPQSCIDGKQKLAGFWSCVMLMSVKNSLDVTCLNDLQFVLRYLVLKGFYNVQIEIRFSKLNFNLILWEFWTFGTPA